MRIKYQQTNVRNIDPTHSKLAGPVQLTVMYLNTNQSFVFHIDIRCSLYGIVYSWNRGPGHFVLTAAFSQIAGTIPKNERYAPDVSGPCVRVSRTPNGLGPGGLNGEPAGRGPCRCSERYSP